MIRPLRAVAGLLLALCATDAAAVSLHQAAFVPGTTVYRFGYRSIPTVPVRGAPADTDWGRWAMLHDGSVYRLYAFRRGTRDTLYQFGFDPAASAYVHGHESIPILRIVGAPEDADAGSIAMLHDGRVYRLYMRSRTGRDVLYQFGFNTTTQRYEHGHESIPTIPLVASPRDADWRRWAMLHDGTHYRLYVFRSGRSGTLYQAAFDPAKESYRFGHESIPELTVESVPASSDTRTAAMLHDGANFRFYFQASTRPARRRR